MFKTFLKLLTIYFVNRQVVEAKEDLKEAKASAAKYFQSRVSHMKRDLSQDLHCVLMTFLGYFCAIALLLLALAVGLAWAVLVGWNSDNSVFILSSIIVVLISVGLALLIHIRKRWLNYQFFETASVELVRDWSLLKRTMEPEHHVS